MACTPKSARLISASAAIWRNTSPPGTRARSRASATSRDAEVVPVPGRPEIVTSNAAASAEGLEERLALLLAETTDAAGVGDADLLHRAPGLHLADAGEGLDDGEDLHLPD